MSPYDLEWTVTRSSISPSFKSAIESGSGDDVGLFPQNAIVEIIDKTEKSRRELS